MLLSNFLCKLNIHEQSALKQSVTGANVMSEYASRSVGLTVAVGWVWLLGPWAGGSDRARVWSVKNVELGLCVPPAFSVV